MSEVAIGPRMQGEEDRHDQDGDNADDRVADPNDLRQDAGDCLLRLGHETAEQALRLAGHDSRPCRG